MPNIKSIISSHNKSVLKNQSVTSASQAEKDCNCQKKDTFPLSGKCSGLPRQFLGPGAKFSIEGPQIKTSPPPHENSIL